jgi:hypothetical protein
MRWRAGRLFDGDQRGKLSRPSLQLAMSALGRHSPDGELGLRGGRLAPRLESARGASNTSLSGKNDRI